MIQPGQLFKAVKRLWDATPALTAAVPGHLWENRPAQAAASPYAVARIVPGNVQWLSGGWYLHTFALTITTYSNAGATDATAIEKALEARLHRNRAQELVVPGCRTVDILPSAGSAETDEATLDSKDVQATASAWEITLQGKQ